MRPRVSRNGGGVLLAAALSLWLPHAAFAQEANSDLPPGEGRVVVTSLCSACHSLNIVKQQGMSRERWAWTLNWMVEKQGMPRLPETMNTQVLDYLATHFGPDHRQAGSGMGMAPGSSTMGSGMTSGGMAPAAPPPPAN